MKERIRKDIVYKFDELSEEAKEKAIERLADINVDYEWWNGVYEDAENIGLKIVEFDLDRGPYAKGVFKLSANEVAQNIINNHGDMTETYKTARGFMDQWEPVFSEYMDEKSEHYESRESEDKMMELEDEFLKSLCEDYRIILQHEWDYLVSEEAIRETIEANEYEFTEDGRIA